MKRLLFAAIPFAGAGWLAGCSTDPFSPVVDVAHRPATILPSQAPEKRADGFANILADPAPVAGLPRTPHEIAADEAAVAAEGAHLEARAASLSGGSQAAALSARGRSHVAATKAAIEASARPANPALLPRAEPLPAPQNRAARAPGEPVDPNTPLPRTVGGPAFLGDPVAGASTAD
ncbi:MAG: hypothetical protein AAF318_00665 [Pseudomonadota bacterium]